MSKAFTDEETPVPDGAEALPPRERDLPITRAGLARLRVELAELSAAGPSEIGARRARVIAQVLRSVYVQKPSLVDGRVGFGTSVIVEGADGRRTCYEIVGPDEVEPARGQISVASPVARALLGKRAGDLVVLRRPRGDIEVTVASVTVAPDDVLPPPATAATQSDDADRRER
jgi:transcription elongation factor GreB